jgi:lysophospholipase L1-like esterase
MARALALSAALIAALALPPVAVADVLVVGDSLEVGTGPHLKRELAGERVTVDASTGRPSGEGLRVLAARLRPEHDVLVFDIGVNDDPSQPGALASDLAAARRAAGKRCMVVATVERPALNGVNVDGLNQAVESFARSDPNAQLVDWQGAVRGRRGLLNPDGVHPTPAGYALRGRLVAEAVQACIAGGAPSGGAPEPEPAPRLGPVPRRPLLLSWSGLARTSPVAGVLAAIEGALGAVRGAADGATARLGPAGEPVLGGS